MLDFDLKQSHQKLEHLCEQKERLEDEVLLFTFYSKLNAKEKLTSAFSV